MDNYVNDLKRRIKNTLADLTENQKRIAIAILENPQKFALSSIRQLEEELNTSKATIVRFTQALGYEGFQELRSLLLDGLRKNADPIYRYRSLLEDPGKQQKNNHLQAVADESIENIQRTLRLIDSEQWERAVSLLVHAEHVYTMGLGVSSILAELAAYLFHRVSLKSSHFTTGTLSFVEQIVGLNKNDLIFAFSLPAYSRETILAVEYAEEKGIKIISLTDSLTNEIIQYSDAYLRVATETNTISNSISSIQVVLYALCSQIAFEQKEETIRTIDSIAHVREEHSGLR